MLFSRFCYQRHICMLFLDFHTGSKLYSTERHALPSLKKNPLWIWIWTFFLFLTPKAVPIWFGCTFIYFLWNCLYWMPNTYVCPSGADVTLVRNLKMAMAMLVHPCCNCDRSEYLFLLLSSGYPQGSKGRCLLFFGGVGGSASVVHCCMFFLFAQTLCSTWRWC